MAEPLWTRACTWATRSFGVVFCLGSPAPARGWRVLEAVPSLSGNTSQLTLQGCCSLRGCPASSSGWYGVGCRVRPTVITGLWCWMMFSGSDSLKILRRGQERPVTPGVRPAEVSPAVRHSRWEQRAAVLSSAASSRTAPGGLTEGPSAHTHTPGGPQTLPTSSAPTFQAFCFPPSALALFCPHSVGPGSPHPSGESALEWARLSTLSTCQHPC